MTFELRLERVKRSRVFLILTTANAKVLGQKRSCTCCGVFQEKQGDQCG